MPNKIQTQATNYEDWPKKKLVKHIRTLETQISESTNGYSRRSVISAAAAVAGLGAMGVYATGTASAAPSGTFPEATDDPLLKIRADRVRFVGRTSDPASPDNGTAWYRSDL